MGSQVMNIVSITIFIFSLCSCVDFRRKSQLVHSKTGGSCEKGAKASKGKDYIGDDVEGMSMRMEIGYGSFGMGNLIGLFGMNGGNSFKWKKSLSRSIFCCNGVCGSKKTKCGPTLSFSSNILSSSGFDKMHKETGLDQIKSGSRQTNSHRFKWYINSEGKMTYCCNDNCRPKKPKCGGLEKGMKRSIGLTVFSTVINQFGNTMHCCNGKCGDKKMKCQGLDETDDVKH